MNSFPRLLLHVNLAGLVFCSERIGPPHLVLSHCVWRKRVIPSDLLRLVVDEWMLIPSVSWPLSQLIECRNCPNVENLIAAQIADCNRDGKNASITLLPSNNVYLITLRKSRGIHWSKHAQGVRCNDFNRIQFWIHDRFSCTFGRRMMDHFTMFLIVHRDHVKMCGVEGYYCDHRADPNSMILYGGSKWCEIPGNASGVRISWRGYGTDDIKVRKIRKYETGGADVAGMNCSELNDILDAEEMNHRVERDQDIQNCQIQ